MHYKNNVKKFSKHSKKILMNIENPNNYVNNYKIKLKNKNKNKIYTSKKLVKSKIN